MSYIYKPFPLDSWVSQLYKSLAIHTPADIDLQTIANKLGINLIYSSYRCYARVEGSFKLINLNHSLNECQQREVFFHELCHILRHEGNQYQSMPHAFRELQEWDAAHFTRYASIPFHMLKFVDFKSHRLIEEMSCTFKVSEDICECRVEHIMRNRNKIFI